MLEHKLGADLSALRVHTGPTAGRWARALGADAFTYGRDVYFAPGAFRPDTAAGMWLLAHETTHALQQSRGPVAGVAADVWEHEADHCADMVVRGRRIPAPIGPAVVQSPAPAIQRHVSFEHRLLGDGRTPDLVSISTKGPNRAQILKNQIQLLQLWQSDPGHVTEAKVKELCPWIRTTRVGRDQVLATYGELNALPDYLSDPASIEAMDRDILLPILQVIRQEGFNQLTLIASGTNPNVKFPDAASAPWKLSLVNNILETSALDTLTFGLGARGENHYQGLLARNACHFAPYSWYRWREFHMIARDLAREAHATKDDGLARRAWAFHGYADHFLQDSFAAGHLVNKTLVMQWFIEWAAGQKLLPIADWDEIKGMTAANQPGLAPLALYDPNYKGSSTDPQTAQEAATLADRVVASGVAKGTSPDKLRAYQTYLTFLTSAATQLASANLHDHYNANSLWVASSATTSAYEVWGDDTLFTGRNGGKGVEQTSQTAQMSQDALKEILATGRTSIGVEQIRSYFPTKAGSDAAKLEDLKDWNLTQEAYCKKTSFPDFTAELKTILLRLASPRLGVVSQDQAFASEWATSLPKSGYTAVRTLLADGRMFVGSNGYVYELDPKTGRVLHSLELSSYGGTTTVATDGTRLYAGVHGYVYGVSLADWSKYAWYLGVGGTGAFAGVNVLVHGSRLFAASNGYVYEVDPASGKTLHSRELTSSFAGGDTSIATDGTRLYAGVHGYVYGVALADWSKYAWYLGVGGKVAFTNVNVLLSGSRLFAGANGYVYEVDPATGKQLHDRLLASFVGAGNYDTTLATDGTTLFAGAHGYVYGVSLGDWSKARWDLGVGGTGAYKAVSVLSSGPRLFAGSNGYVYEIDPSSGKQRHALLLTYIVGVGNFDTDVATDGRDLYAGVHGYSYKVLVNDPTREPDQMRVMIVANDLPYPFSASFTTRGGTLLVQFAGSAWTNTAQQMVSVSLLMDNKREIATASVFANNAGMHMALVPVAVVLEGVNAGEHTFTVSSRNQLDRNDLFNITVTEYFPS